MMRFDAHYELLRSKFRHVLAELSGQLPDRDIEEVREYVDYNEFGLALDDLLAACAQSGHILNDHHRETLNHLATLMEQGIAAEIPMPGVPARELLSVRVLPRCRSARRNQADSRAPVRFRAYRRKHIVPRHGHAA